VEAAESVIYENTACWNVDHYCPVYFAADWSRVFSFQHGHIWRYEIEQFTADSDGSGPVPFDGDIEPAGKTDGQFQVYHYLVGRDFERGHLEISQTYVDAFNERMRLYISHPEWFDKDGNRIPLNKSTYQTNDQTTVSN
jgi:hypothetical protein